MTEVRKARPYTCNSSMFLVTNEVYLTVLLREKYMMNLLFFARQQLAGQEDLYDSLLNGLEVFKINDTCGNFGSQNPVPIKRYCYSDEFLQKTKDDDANCKPGDKDD